MRRVGQSTLPPLKGTLLQRILFPDYVSAQGPVPTPWTQVDPFCLLNDSRVRLERAHAPKGWGAGRVVLSHDATMVDVFQQGFFPGT